MHRLTKRIVMKALFIGIILTPTIAFDLVRTSDAHILDAPRQRPSELKKIAESLRAWPVTDVNSMEEEVSDPPVDAHEDEESQFEIKRLDKTFFDYVMKTYVQRMRRS